MGTVEAKKTLGFFATKQVTASTKAVLFKLPGEV